MLRILQAVSRNISKDHIVGHESTKWQLSSVRILQNISLKLLVRFYWILSDISPPRTARHGSISIDIVRKTYKLQVNITRTEMRGRVYICWTGFNLNALKHYHGKISSQGLSSFQLLCVLCLWESWRLVGKFAESCWWWDRLSFAVIVTS